MFDLTVRLKKGAGWFGMRTIKACNDLSPLLHYPIYEGGGDNMQTSMTTF
ncbi:hypothetical protein J41TS2_46620 [Bacillus sonorensis]|nr:hypothetical protein J41TS2_46620 [Bacillus sonorensis]